jgi:hypothetical protein
MKPATQPVTQTWTYTQDADGDHAIWNGKELIAVTDGWDACVKRTREEDEANARLISSAPELLEALKDVTERLALSLQVFGNSPEVVNANVANARAAIAKATGAEGTL